MSPPAGLPERGAGQQAGPGQRGAAAGGAVGGGAQGQQAGVQQLDQLHVLLEQHVLVQDAAHRVLTEHHVLRASGSYGSQTFNHTSDKE